MIKQQMKYDDLVTLIITRLSEEDDLDDIILEICQKTGYAWSQAELLIKHVQEDNDAKIARKKLPIFYGLAFFTFIGGVILTGYGLYTLMVALISHSELFPRDLTSYFMPVLEKGIDPLSAFKSALYPYLNMVLGFFVSPFSAIFFGAAMLSGSLVGMRDTWAKILNK